MAKNKHFYGFVVISLAFGLFLGGNCLNQVKSASLTEDYREASGQTSIKDLQKSPKLLEKYYSDQLETFGIKLRPGTNQRSDSRPTAQTSTKCRSIVYQTLNELPESHREQIKELTLYYTKDGRRGLAGNGSVVLRCLNVTDAELAAVLVHETGHAVDATLLTGKDDGKLSGFYDFENPVLEDDPSSIFYKISWLSESLKKADATELDFVSLYAMTDPFEDFAETYAYYRLHGREFRQLAKTSKTINAKYEFMKNYVFGGDEFYIGNTIQKDDLFYRNYDVTVLPYPLKRFFS